MKFAVIDVGTNNVLFLIAEKKGNNLEILHRDSNISAMGKHMTNNLLSSAAIHRTKNILRDNIRFAKMFTDNVIVIGTSCSREAKNIDQIINWLQNRFNLNYNIISGDEEAHLNGLAINYEFKDKTNIVTFDVGGGSTEFTILHNGEIVYKKSLSLGIRRLDNNFSKDFSAKTEATRKELKKLDLPKSNNFSLIGIGGTVTSLSAYRYHLQNYKPDLVHKSTLKTKEVNKMLQEFLSMTDDEIAFLMPFDRYRADIIATGTMIVVEILKQFDVEEFTISDRGLQFGVLLQSDEKIQAMLE